MYTEQTAAGDQRPAPRGEAITVGGSLVRVRPFNFSSSTDYRRVVAVSNAIDPEFQESVAAWQHWDQNRDPHHLFRRYLLEREGEVVAYGSYGHIEWSFQPDRYYLWVGVHPGQQRKGYGSALWDYLMTQLSERQPAELVTFTRENRPQAIDFLQKRGFAVRMREQISRINPQTFELAPFSSKIAEVERSGIKVITLADIMQRDPEWRRHMYELEAEVEKDVLSIDEVTKSEFEVYEKQTLGMPNLLHEGWFVAMDGDEYVGLSVLWRDLVNEKRLGTGLTGVKRSHRRRGIATAMKAKALSFARGSGATIVDTGNEENNPMYQLNLQLGFQPLPAELVLTYHPNGELAAARDQFTEDNPLAQEN
jgi:ribosomal protein S18 acetylase RimI-like enzyme